MRLGPNLPGLHILGGRSRGPGEPAASEEHRSWRDRLRLPQRLGTHRGADPGGTAFALVTVTPALVIAAWLVAGLPLLLAGRFLPVPMVLISVPVMVGLLILTGRNVPGPT